MIQPSGFQGLAGFFAAVRVGAGAGWAKFAEGSARKPPSGRRVAPDFLAGLKPRPSEATAMVRIEAIRTTEEGRATRFALGAGAKRPRGEWAAADSRTSPKHLLK